MRRIAIPIVILTLAATTLLGAPRPGAPGAPPPQQHGPGGEILPPQLLAEFLDLSESQIAQVAQLRESLRAAVEPLRQQQRANAEALRDAVEAGNAARAGELVLANHKLAGQIKAAHDDFRADFEALLTAEQKTKLAIYEEIVALRNRGPRE